MNISQSLATGQGVTLSEALSMGGLTTVLGLTIVFSVLIILMIILMLFKVIFYKKNEKKKPIIEETAPAQAEAAENDEELVAVLTAAVAAYLNTSTYNLKIKSYRRINDDRPIWNKAGIQDTINGRF